jgi:hypothetical protein
MDEGNTTFRISFASLFLKAKFLILWVIEGTSGSSSILEVSSSTAGSSFWFVCQQRMDAPKEPRASIGPRGAHLASVSSTQYLITIPGRGISSNPRDAPSRSWGGHGLPNSFHMGGGRLQRAWVSSHHEQTVWNQLLTLLLIMESIVYIGRIYRRTKHKSCTPSTIEKSSMSLWWEASP